MSLLCVQELAELKEEDLPSDIAVIPSSHTCTFDSSDAITPHTPTTPGPVVSVSSTELPVALPSLLPTAAAGVSGDLSRTLGEIILRNSHCPCYYVFINNGLQRASKSSSSHNVTQAKYYCEPVQGSMLITNIIDM